MCGLFKEPSLPQNITLFATRVSQLKIWYFLSLLLHRPFRRITLIINQQMHLHNISQQRVLELFKDPSLPQNI